MAAPRKIAFKTELKQLMDIIIHSLYTNREVFLRELISNASDAIDVLRFDSLTDKKLRQESSQWKIKLVPHEEAGTLTVSDNGIGMNREEIARNLGTIARSGTRELLDKLKDAGAGRQLELIGQFGVGFYSSFMVADKVTVVSRKAGEKPADAVKWVSDGQGKYTVEPAEKQTCGTDVVLHLRSEDKDYLQSWRIRQIVRKFSDFIEHPVVMDVEAEKDGGKRVEEEMLNSRQAIWLRSKSEVAGEEYREFYKHITRDVEDPARVVHYAAEGTLNFKALLFLPAHKPFELFSGQPRSRLQLYINRVFITDDCDKLLPAYLRFVRGVVDCADLPLNVSREMVQQNPLLEKIQRNLVKKVLADLEEMKSKEYGAYRKFFSDFGTVLKEGAYADFSNRESLADLLLFESTGAEPGDYVTLAKYVENMPEGQEEIYYLFGESRPEMEKSPYLEVFRQRGREVLLLTDPIDEWTVQGLAAYKGKKFKAVDRGELEEKEPSQSSRKDEKEKFAGLLEYLSGQLEDVEEVRLSARLTESAACLVSPEDGMGAQMERLLKRIGRQDDLPESRRILELNPEHPAVVNLQEIHRKDPDDPRVIDHARLLYDLAVVAEGSKVKDPAAFARRINELLLKDRA
ncbi:MAG: molecular chaperone HtpG [Candidatus Glassbacteria bacterium]|nr:molecular chaperone HtpG [Candidatus Glassbacteria bacterium]